MKLVSLDYEKDWTPASTTLSSGLVVEFPKHLEGGGSIYKQNFLDVIKANNRKYSRAFEWCAGHGVIGFELLTSGICEHLVFSDYYDTAIKNCLETANKNNLPVTGYITSTIAEIPTTEKWDLVVSNPPWNWNLSHTEMLLKNEFKTDSEVSNMLRILVDQDYQIHKEFFQNIGNYITDDADIYIIENNRDPVFNKMAKDFGNFDTIKVFHVNGGGIFHFKKGKKNESNCME